MKKLLSIFVFSIFILSFTSCDDEYETGEIAPQNDARIIRVSIDVRDVPYDSQRTFYNHDANEVIVQVLPGMDLTTIRMYVTPVLFSEMSPNGLVVEEDWTSPKTFTVTSGDGSVTNAYSVTIVEVTAFGDNNPWG